ncbi:MAG: tetratricopeptide repeat protein [Myxococcales bacterium]|nr:tetratricopeptide repeat protein [Myxococcales bacterium]
MSRVLLGSMLALAMGANGDLEEARRLYDSMLFRLAEAQLRSLVRKAPPQDVRREAYDLLARALAAQSRLEEAEAAYAQLLEADPHAPGPRDAAPKVRKVFQRAKERLYPPGFAQLERVPAEEPVVEVRLVDPWSIVREVVLMQALGPSGYSGGPMKFEPGGARAAISGAPSSEPVRWYVEARDAEGRAVCQLGHPSAPFSYSVEAPPLDAEEPREQPKLEPLAALPPEPAPEVVVVRQGLPEAQPYRPVALGLLGGALASGSAGLILGIRSSQARSQILGAPVGPSGRVSGLTQRRAFELERQMKSDAAMANGLFIGAAGLAIAGSVLLWMAGAPPSGETGAVSK